MSTLLTFKCDRCGKEERAVNDPLWGRNLPTGWVIYRPNRQRCSTCGNYTPGLNIEPDLHFCGSECRDEWAASHERKVGES